jgi:hypothetical protein
MRPNCLKVNRRPNTLDSAQQPIQFLIGTSQPTQSSLQHIMGMGILIYLAKGGKVLELLIFEIRANTCVCWIPSKPYPLPPNAPTLSCLRATARPASALPAGGYQRWAGGGRLQKNVATICKRLTKNVNETNIFEKCWNIF